MDVETKLPKVGTTIFTVMSQLAVEHGAVNLGQGFPDFAVPGVPGRTPSPRMREGKNQYAPMTGVPALRQAIAAKTLDCYGATVDADTEVTVTSGASEAIFDAVLAVVRPGDEGDRARSLLRLLRARDRPGRRPRGAHSARSGGFFRALGPGPRRGRAEDAPAVHQHGRTIPPGAMLDATDMATLADIVRDTA
jgi:methionine aminotransferase